MKKTLKRLCTGFLALATVVTALPTTPVHAESKRNHVDYQHLWYIYNLCRYVLDCFVKE